jgi:hypothetical protein
MGLRHTLQLAHEILSKEGIEHALIGGLALASLGINRATGDVDLLAEGIYRDRIKSIFQKAGFKLHNETPEVLHFEGPGFVDILLANRPISKQMLAHATVVHTLGIKCLEAEDIIGLKIQAYMNNKKRELQDKADIQSLISKHKNMDWNKIKQYADAFGQWEEICRLKDLA